jgi:hypothetical protein
VKEEYDIALSRSTLDHIRHLLHFAYKAPKRRQGLTPTQIGMRYQFGLDYASGATTGAAPDELFVVFSDESRFCMTSDKHWLWRRRGQLDDTIYASEEKFPVSIMVWGRSARVATRRS